MLLDIMKTNSAAVMGEHSLLSRHITLNTQEEMYLKFAILFGLFFLVAHLMVLDAENDGMVESKG